MKFGPTLLGMLACSLLPLAGAQASTVSDSVLQQAGVGVELSVDASRTAENFGRKESDDKKNRDDDRKGGKDNHGGGNDGHGGNDHDDHDGGHGNDKSPCKPGR